MTTLKGVFPDPKPPPRKNFIRENVRNLKRMEHIFHSNKESEDLEKQKRKIEDKYQKVGSKVFSNLDKPKSGNQKATSVPQKNVESINVVSKNEEARRKVDRSHKKHNLHKTDLDGSEKNRHKENGEKDPNFDLSLQISNESRGIQTLDSDDIETIYAEGVIRYPSSTSRERNIDVEKDNAKKEKSDYSKGEEKITSPLPNSQPCDRGDAQPRNCTLAKKIATRLNEGNLAQRQSQQQQPTKSEPQRRKGQVPKYILERKEALKKQEEEAKAALALKDCPEGHVPLPDDERKETLRMLKKTYQEYINELNKMPIKTDTLRAQRRKLEIEKQLTKLEEGIKVFSRPKVYVKINA